MLFLLKLLSLLSLLMHDDHIVSARQTLSRQLSASSNLTISNISTASSLIQAHSSPSASTSRPIINNHTQATAGATALLPISPYTGPEYAGNHKATGVNSDTKFETCSIKQDYCSFTKSNRTIGKGNATTNDVPCLLWDSSCSGNRTSAIDTFFDQTFQHDLLNNKCFVQAGSINLVKGSDCDKYNPPGRMSEFQKMKNWMRSQQCVSVANAWTAKYTGGEDPDSKIAVQMDPLEYHVVSGPIPSCCGPCNTNVQNVDIYYWPKPIVNTSCLSIVGGSVRPVDYGATTTVWNVGTITSTEVYWDCKPKTSGDPIWTAEIRTIGSLRVKVYLSDPWSRSPCTETDAVSQGSAETYAQHATLQARDHTLIIPSSISHNGSIPVTTMVSGNFTFTSPSIYANFHGITATDQCGGLVVSSTMVAFAPGELATIAGPLGIDDGENNWTTKSFNFDDLPCPPQNVMEANWYKPQPGEPYRPLVALPKKLKKMMPWLSHCSDELFTAYDPPSALTVATALAPPISHNNHPWAPVPSPTLDPKAEQTASVKASVPVPANVPILDEPKATVTAASTPSKQKGSDLRPQPNDPATQKSASSQLGSHSQVSSDNLQQGSDPDNSSGNGGDAMKGKDPKLDNSSNRVDNDPEPNHHAKSVPQDPSEQTNEVNPFKDFSEGQTRTINDQAVQLLSHGISIAGTTLTPGARSITLSDTPIHFGPSALVIGTSTVTLVPEDPNPDPLTTTVAGHIIKVASDAIAVAGTTLTPGAPPISVSDTPIHFASSALIIGTSTLPLAPTAPTQIITTIAGQLITAAPSALTVPGTTLSPGSPGVTVAGTLISLDAATHQLMVGTKAIPLDPASGKNPLVTQIGGRVISAFPDKIAIASTTLTPVASGVVVGGTLLSLNTAAQVIAGSKTIITLQSGRGTGFVIGGLGTVEIPSPEDKEKIADPHPHPLVTTNPNGQPITTAFAIAGTTLTPGAASGLTINGTLVSLNTAAQLLVVGFTTFSLAESATFGAVVTEGVSDPAGPSDSFVDTISPSPTLSVKQGNTSTAAGVADGNGNATSPRTPVQIFQGRAAPRSSKVWSHVAASLSLAIALAMALPLVYTS